MTVLNTANDGYYNVLIVLYRAVVAYGATSRDKLLDLCSPRFEEPTRLRQTLNRWIELGLFSEDGEIVSLAPIARPSTDGIKAVARATEGLPAIVRRIVFASHNNERFWDSTGSRSADLTRGIAWLLAQDIYAVELGRHNEVQLIESRQIIDPERRIVQNDVRWRGLLAWARYLGFLWYSDGPMIDPTIALRDDLQAIFASASEVTASEFVSRAATMLPVLDEGAYRVAVEGVLDPAQWRRAARPDLLSSALSRALWRLDAAGVLVLEQRADAGDSRVLQRREGQEWRRFTHVRLGGQTA